MAHVRDLVAAIDEHGFERWFLPHQQVITQREAVGDHAFHQRQPRRPREVQAVAVAVSVFEHVDDADALRVVSEAALALHERVERVFTHVPERRVSEIVRQRDRFREIRVEAERERSAARHLRHFEGVGHPTPVVVALVCREYLGLVLEPTECRAVDHAIPVPLERCAQRILGFGQPPPPGGVAECGAVSESFAFLGLQVFSAEPGHVATHCTKARRAVARRALSGSPYGI